ncbi:hypothetical protein ACSBR2_012532 [Camellia fascicularis]
MWKRFINTFPGRKVGHDKSLKQAQAFELVRLLWKMVIKQDDSEISDLIRSPSRLLFVAAEHGNTKFLIELIEAYPDLIWKVNSQNQSIFHVAVLHHHAGIFNILDEIGSIKDLITEYRDEDCNNMLHLAAKIAPPNQLNIVSGAALQIIVLNIGRYATYRPIRIEKMEYRDGYTPIYH